MEQSAPVLHRALVTADDAEPARWAFGLHGILGSGGNLRTIAQRVADEVPGWGVALVDVRMHGLSQGFAPPHTLRAAAEDLLGVETELPGKVAGVIGHSVGGKVALVYAERRRALGDPLEHLVVLDASPSPRDARSSTPDKVLRMLEEAPQPFASRPAFADYVLGHGYSQAMASWLTMNLVHAEDGFRIRLRLPAIRELLEDYFAADLWHLLESGDAAGRIDFVVGGRSEVVDASDRVRLEALAARGKLRLHVLPNAGHWLHVEDPNGVVGAVTDALVSGAEP